MTVPGKGGRPRKWRSDADRVRAYRARQRGEPEPPELAAALQDGDELAMALEEVRRLASELTEQRHVGRSFRRELASLRRDAAAQALRLERLNAESLQLGKALASAEEERWRAEARVTGLLAENQDLRQQLGRLASSPSASVPTSGPRASRAQRREAARAARRRRT